MCPRILVVDDDENMRRYYSLALANESCAVATFSNGADALAAAVQTKPDLILCDLTMPHMSGLEFLSRFRSHATLMSIPVIAVSASIIKSTVGQLLSAGFSGTLAKPFALSELHSKIAECLALVSRASLS